MRKKVIKETVVFGVVCDKCGKFFSSYFEEPITEIEMNFGYGSTKIKKDTCKIDLCDDCLEEFRNSLIDESDCKDLYKKD